MCVDSIYIACHMLCIYIDRLIEITPHWGRDSEIPSECPRFAINDEACMLQILDTRIGFPSPSLNVVNDYFSHYCPKMCKICLHVQRRLDATFLDCLALTFCDAIGELLPEWACLTLQDGTTFLLTSKLADIPVSRVRILLHIKLKCYFCYSFLTNRRPFTEGTSIPLPSARVVWVPERGHLFRRRNMHMCWGVWGTRLRPTNR